MSYRPSHGPGHHSVLSSFTHGIPSRWGTRSRQPGHPNDKLRGAGGLRQGRGQTHALMSRRSNDAICPLSNVDIRRSAAANRIPRPTAERASP
jgi:hypothetical protein